VRPYLLQVAALKRLPATEIKKEESIAALLFLLKTIQV